MSKKLRRGWDLTSREMEALRVACSHMQGKELARAGEQLVANNSHENERALTYYRLYGDLWLRLYRLQYGVEPPPLTDAATCTG